MDTRSSRSALVELSNLPRTLQVALVIPAWNETESIGAVLAEVPRDIVDSVFVVVGPGNDPTADVAAAHGARPLAQAQPGYGAACWEGSRAAMAAGADVIAFLDGDYSDPPAELDRVLKPVLTGESDVALGTRDVLACPAALPLHARLGNHLVLLALQGLLHRQLNDLPSFKAIRTDCLQHLEMREMTYGWTVEMLVKSVRAGFRMAEIPVTYRPRLGGRSKVSGTVRGSLGAAWSLSSCAIRYAAWKPGGLVHSAA